MDWQPIDSAPKIHAREILATTGTRFAVIFWLDPSRGLYRGDHTEGWYISDGKNDPIWYRGWLDLTHWAPLDLPGEHSSIPIYSTTEGPKETFQGKRA